MLTDTHIRTIFQEMQQLNGIIPEPDPQYIVSVHNKYTLELYGNLDWTFIPTDQLSDIHAILQLCHPNTPYSIYQNIRISDEFPEISIYSHQHQPNILTNQYPPHQHDNNYIIQPTSACNITIQPNEPLLDAIDRIRNQIKKSFPFIPQYPHIDFNTQQLGSIQHVPHLDNVDIHITACRTHPSNIDIILGLSNGSNWTNIKTFIIPTQHITKLHDTYIAHIHKITPKFIEHIQENFACSQHEKIRIIRQCVPYLTAPNNNVFTCIQDCVHILMNHYACTPPISPP